MGLFRVTRSFSSILFLFLFLFKHTIFFIINFITFSENYFVWPNYKFSKLFLNQILQIKSFKSNKYSTYLFSMLMIIFFEFFTLWTERHFLIKNYLDFSKNIKQFFSKNISRYKIFAKKTIYRDKTIVQVPVSQQKSYLSGH